MTLQRLYNPLNGKMRVAGLMSGSGTNLIKIIEAAKFPHDYFKVALIFTDNLQSNAIQIGKDFDIPVVIRDLDAFCMNRAKPRKDMITREEYDRETAKILADFEIDVAAYAGYMCRATKPLINAALGINGHPADLTILNEEGKRKYTGDAAVKKAILAGEKELRSTVHIVTEQVDYGKILAVSSPIPVQIPANWNPEDSELVKLIAKEHQERLKIAGDWQIFPRVIRDIAEGKYSQDKQGNLYHNNKPIPNGVRL